MCFQTASFAMYIFSLSVLLQSLIVVTMSGAADHGQYRKTLLIIFALTGSIATILFLPVTPKVYLLGSLWAIIGNICIGASFVLLNSFLPLLVRNHPSTRHRLDDRPERMAAEDEVSKHPFIPYARCSVYLQSMGTADPNQGYHTIPKIDGSYEVSYSPIV
jgi:hypothetical protein